MPTRLPPVVGYLAVAAAAAVPAAAALAPGTDADAGWHLRVGELVAAGDLPHVDPFSRRDRPTPWVAYSWLFEWGLFRFDAALGPAALPWARTLLAGGSAAAVFGVLVRRAAWTLPTLLAVGMTALTLAPLARERPWHFTIAFTAITTAVVGDLRAGTSARRAPWLPLLFALWANLHIQFVLGGLVLALACVFPGRAGRRSLLVLTLGCAAATLLNPYHVRLAGVVWEYATQTGPLRSVRELAPPDFGDKWTWAGLALAGWAMVAALRRRPVDGFDAGLAAAALVFSLRMRRDVWLTSVAAGGAIRDPEARPRGWAVAAVVFAVFVGLRLAVPVDPAREAAADEATYPVRAAAFVREHELPGPLFNTFDWGGYLIRALPGRPVSVDGRTNLYGSERVLRAMATVDGEPGWDADPELLSANLAIVPAARRLADLLREPGSGWRAAYEDATAVVFVRDGR